MKLNLLTVAATAALLSTGALAQDRPTATDPATPPAVTTPAPGGSATTTTTRTTTEAIQFSSGISASQMMMSELKNINVRNAAGENLGDISDLVIDVSGKPAHAILGVGGFLGLGEKYVAVPFDALTFTMDTDKKQVARLDVTKAALEAAPRFVYRDKKEAVTQVAPKTQ